MSQAFHVALGFAVVAGLGALPWVLFWAPSMGRSDSFVAYCLALLVIYPLFLAPDRRRGVRIAALAAGLAATAFVAGILTSSPLVALILGCFCLGLVRSGFLFRQKPARALALEAGLLIAGLLFAAFLNPASGLLSIALAVWVFFLIQALFFTVGGSRPRAPEAAGDPFDQAYERALALITDPALAPGVKCYDPPH